ncbi:MAG: hypothetical protein FWH18_12205 [Marinilabiliaceae bacterium]|nr:hypothetical protein [Marinilabiliaceae bacterium]
MNRTIKLSVLTCILTSLILTGCKDNSETGGENVIIDNTITAKVENGNEYNGYISEVWGRIEYDNINFEYIATTHYSNGGFTIELPSAVEDSLLMKIENGFGNEFKRIRNFSISDKSALIGFVFFFGVDDDGNLLDDFYHVIRYENETSTSFTGKWGRAIYVYVNKDVTITASDSWDEDGDREEMLINLPFKKGWNAAFLLEEYSANYIKDTDIIKTSLTTRNPGGLKWYFGYTWDEYYQSIYPKSEEGISFEKFKNSSTFFSKLFWK